MFPGSIAPLIKWLFDSDACLLQSPCSLFSEREKKKKKMMVNHWEKFIIYYAVTDS